MLDDMKKGKKRKKITEEQRDEFRRTVERMVERMGEAADKDTEAFTKNELATNKIKMLAEVTEFINKETYQKFLTDAKSLAVLKQWLDPMPDRSLPPTTIRDVIFKALSQFPMVDVKDLKKCELGKTIRFLSNHPEETVKNRKIARDLIERWSRPLFNRSADNDDPEAPQHEAPWIQLKKAAPVEENPLDKYLREKNAKIATFRARIPQKSDLDYTIRPQSDPNKLRNSGEGVNAPPPPTQKLIKKSRFEKHFEKMKSPAKKNVRAVKLSVEGRMLSH